MKTKLFILIWLQVSVALVQAQGFVNLNFEAAKNLGSANFWQLDATNAFPGWTVNAQYIIYDDISLSGNSISIIDTNSPYWRTPIQGKYYALLASGNYPPSARTISLAQTGTIPLGTQSITFWGYIGGMQITFAGQSLAFTQTGSTANYNIYAANISTYAGQTGQLLFSLPPFDNNANFLDNIQFSTIAVPEPGVWSLLGLSTLLVGGWRGRQARLSKLGVRGGKC